MPMPPSAHGSNPEVMDWARVVGTLKPSRAVALTTHTVAGNLDIPVQESAA